jgi:invasion protein IalB
MRQTLRWALACTSIVAAAVAAPASAQTPKFVSSFKDWTVYEVADGKGKMCYAASEPTGQDGTIKSRGNPAVLVARLPGSSPTDQVSVQPGYTYRKNSTVEVKVESRTFQLFTKGEHAWAKTEADDKALIDAMRRGTIMTIRGTSVRDTYSLDTYSLNGFSAAYDAMRNACAK